MDGRKPDNEQLRLVTDILEELHDGLCITDENGYILQLGRSCERLYGITDFSFYIGRHVSVLEDEGVFSPALSLLALQRHKKVTMTQPDRFGNALLVTACPIYDKTSHNLVMVVSYASWDSSNASDLQRHYDKLQKELYRNNMELNQLKRKLLNVDVIAKSHKMARIRQTIERVKDTDAEILITGENGTGKSNLGKYIHNVSERRDHPFGSMSCSTFSSEILRDELFGYIKISPKDGNELEKIGLCEILDTGTLLLEDIEKMDWDNQAILLYLLKNKCYYKQNGKRPKTTDIRIIATSQVSPEELSKYLMDELFYRITVVTIEMPTLKERKEDIAHFVDSFLNQFNEKYRKNISIAPQAMDLLENYSWPGNVTQLKYMIQQIILTIDDQTIQTYHLPDYVSPFSSSLYNANIDLKEYLEYYECRLIMQAYDKCKTTQKLAKYLGISQSSAVRKIKKYINKEPEEAQASG